MCYCSPASRSNQCSSQSQNVLFKVQGNLLEDLSISIILTHLQFRPPSSYICALQNTKQCRMGKFWYPFYYGHNLYSHHFRAILVILTILAIILVFLIFVIIIFLINNHCNHNCLYHPCYDNCPYHPSHHNK